MFLFQSRAQKNNKISKDFKITDIKSELAQLKTEMWNKSKIGTKMTTVQYSEALL